MELIIEIINTYGVKLPGMIAYIIFGTVALFIKQLATKTLNTETKQNLAKTAVLAVEQMYKDIHGEEKLTAAMNLLSEGLKEYNINISTSEMKLLLEAAVGEFNRVFEKSGGA